MFGSAYPERTTAAPRAKRRMGMLVGRRMEPNMVLTMTR
jgi:hypothetical protein